MFAGPNGSGKTTIKEELNRPAEWFGIYINPDEMEKSLQTSHEISLKKFDLNFSIEELKLFFRNSEFLKAHQLNDDAASAIQLHDRSLTFKDLQVNSYHTSVLADFLRQRAVHEKSSFSFETVMSSGDKLELLKSAKLQGYRTYLYFVATEDPRINIERVKYRVSMGGHSVPVDKIIARDHRSLRLLPAAIRSTDRAFFLTPVKSNPGISAQLKMATI